MANTECCGLHVVKFAQVLGIIGFVSNIIYLNFISAAVFGAIYYGIEKRESGWLYPALIVLGLSIVFITLALIGFICFVIFAMTQSPVFAVFIVIILLIGLIDFFHIFAFVVVNRARKFILESEDLYPPPSSTTTVTIHPQTVPANFYPQTAEHQNLSNLPGSNYPPQPYPSYPPSQNKVEYPHQPSAPQYPNYPQ